MFGDSSLQACGDIQLLYRFGGTHPSQTRLSNKHYCIWKTIKAKSSFQLPVLNMWQSLSTTVQPSLLCLKARLPPILIWWCFAWRITSAPRIGLCIPARSPSFGMLRQGFFCRLLIGSYIGINGKWISTLAKCIADKISDLLVTILPHFNMTSPNFNRQQDHTELKHCCFFQPSQEQLSMIWDVLLTQNLPNLSKVLQLKQNGLGRLNTWNGLNKISLSPMTCGSKPRYEELIACFIKYFMLDCNSWSATVQGYAQSINKLFEYHGFPIPADLSDKENISTKLLIAHKNVRRW